MKLLLRLVMLLSIGAMASLGFAGEAVENFSAESARSWLAEIDSGNYAKSWKDASAYFRGATSEKSWVDALNGDRKPLGNLISRKLTKSQNARSLPGAPDGNYVVMQFAANFENKKDAVETVTFMREKDGQWKAAGYYIR